MLGYLVSLLVIWLSPQTLHKHMKMLDCLFILERVFKCFGEIQNVESLS